MDLLSVDLGYIEAKLNKNYCPLDLATLLAANSLNKKYSDITSEERAIFKIQAFPILYGKITGKYN